ncbi:MAG TPA: malectin domain-containing carbohydrate-binding protein, partial [Bacteroidales bacterium]
MKRRLFITVMVLVAFLCYPKSFANTWYDSAQVRIDSLRKGNFTFKIVDKDGNAVQDSVKVIHRKHEFPWGISIDLPYNATVPNTYTASSAIIAPADSEVYRTERWAAYLAYLLPAEKGKKYKITVKLSENWFDAAGKRIFDTYVDG